MANVSFALQLLTLLCVAAFAGSALAWWQSSKLASRLRSTTSMQGELTEIRDLLSKIDAWAKRINAREVMMERRANGTDPDSVLSRRAGTLPTDPGQLKAELRRRAGIVAGQPAAHRE